MENKVKEREPKRAKYKEEEKSKYLKVPGIRFRAY